MQTITTIGFDIAKSMFQVHGIDAVGNVLVRRQLKRRHVVAFFHNLPPSAISRWGDEMMRAMLYEADGSDAEIATFCDGIYGVTFPLFAKIEVNGKNAHPLYVWLRQQKTGLLGNSIKWNFTKFLVNKTGVVRARFAPMTKPERLVREVAGLL